jgi:hypothetical protein
MAVTRQQVNVFMNSREKGMNQVAAAAKEAA